LTEILVLITKMLTKVYTVISLKNFPNDLRKKTKKQDNSLNMALIFLQSESTKIGYQ